MAYTTIDNPTLYFEATTYTGGATDVSSLSFQPDWVWAKKRSGSENHGLFDSVRGTTQSMNSNTTAAESARSGSLTSFDSDGWTMGGSDGIISASGSTYVGWAWKAGTTSSISGGSITPAAVSINATSGFGIYRYTGTGSNGTIAHGLGTAPKFIVTKNRDSSSYGWYVYHVGIGATKNLYLHNTDAEVTSSNRWNDTAPTSTLFTLSTNDGVNGSSANMLAYAFSEVKGYSKFGSYTGNGNADGPFVYTGFKPAWVLTKASSRTGRWRVWDNKRSTFNVADKRLDPSSSDAVSTGSTEAIDIISNGFKIRTSEGQFNGDGETNIYMAFAENPFVTAGTKAAGTAR